MEDLRAHDPSDLVARHLAGDRQALAGLVQAVRDRLEHHAGQMLAGLPPAQARGLTDELLDHAVARIRRGLKDIPPTTARDYYALTADQIRRNLRDLALRQRPAPGFDRWAALHEAAGSLPTDLRDVFGITFYHGRTRAAAGKVFGADGRAVHGLWVRACLRLHEAVGGQLPGE